MFVPLLVLSACLATALAQFGTVVDPAVLDACPGYKAENVRQAGANLTADLVLAGHACNVFGPDLQKLQLQVTYETGECKQFVKT